MEVVPLLWLLGKRAQSRIFQQRSVPEILKDVWRGHWGIENRSPYVRDVSMGEDASRISSGAAPQVMAAFRNAAVGFLRCRGVVNVAEALRRNAAQVRPLLVSLGIVKQ